MADVDALPDDEGGEVVDIHVSGGVLSERELAAEIRGLLGGRAARAGRVLPGLVLVAGSVAIVVGVALVSGPVAWVVAGALCWIVGADLADSAP